MVKNIVVKKGWGKFNVKENPVLELVALAIHKRLTIAPFDFSSSGEK